MTIVPRTGPFSASSAKAITFWYQRGKSAAREVRGLGLAMWSRMLAGAGTTGERRAGEHGVGPRQNGRRGVVDLTGGGQRRNPHAAEVRRRQRGDVEGQVGLRSRHRPARSRT